MPPSPKKREISRYPVHINKIKQRNAGFQLNDAKFNDTAIGPLVLTASIKMRSFIYLSIFVHVCCILIYEYVCIIIMHIVVTVIAMTINVGE